MKQNTGLDAHPGTGIPCYPQLKSTEESLRGNKLGWIIGLALVDYATYRNEFQVGVQYTGPYYYYSNTTEKETAHADTLLRNSGGA